MFYVDIDNKRFVSPPSSDSLQGPPSGCSFPPPCPPPARSWESLCEPYKHNEVSVKKPVLIHTQLVSLSFTLVHEDFTPVDITDMTFILAVDNNFDHRDQLIAFSEDFTIVDAVNGVLSFNINCSSQKFQKVLQDHVPASHIMMQMVYYPAGSTNGFSVLQDRGIQLKPRLYAYQGAPDDGSPNYYTKSQIGAILKKRPQGESTSSAGVVINGEGLPSPDIGYFGDMYINTEDHGVFIKRQSQWLFIGYITTELPELFYDVVED